MPVDAKLLKTTSHSGDGVRYSYHTVQHFEGGEVVVAHYHRSGECTMSSHPSFEEACRWWPNLKERC